MSKRNHDEVAGGGLTDNGFRDHKRAKSSSDNGQSITAFIELITNVPALDVKLDKNRPVDLDNLQPATKETLKSLSKSLLHFLPAIKSLAEEEEEEKPRQQHHPSSTNGSAMRDHAIGAIQAALPVTLSKWTVDDIPSSFPPLPAVLDPVIETAAFTHPGMCPRLTDLNYERLEWIGDAHIYQLSSNFIYATFPTLTPGKCSQFRELLVKNQTLREYALKYGFDRRANFPPEFGLDGRSGGTKVTDKERSKVLADLFEAYVAAVIVSDPTAGVHRAAAWLKSLWAGTIAKEIRGAARLEEKAAELPAKNRLANLIMAKGIRIRYEDAPPPSASGAKQKFSRDTRAPLYTVHCYLDGWGETNKLLGWGTAPHKGEAGHKAAECAMNNRKMMQVYVERKRAHVAALEAQRKEE